MVAHRILLAAGLALWLGGCSDTTAPEPTRPLTTITVGGEHSCALTDQGTAYCWGSSSHGQVGRGEVGASYARPVRVATGLRFRAITAGDLHTCAIELDDAAYCWGSNARGQLGTGGAAGQDRPAAVAGDERFASLSAGGNHTCGVTLDGRILCWGDNAHGQLGDGTLATRPEPTPIALDEALQDEAFQAVAAGTFHTCALTQEGLVRCWGSNAAGQLGDETTEDRPVPVPIVSQATFESVTAGSEHSCALTAGEVIYCWGSNVSGEMGVNWFSPKLDQPTPVLRPEAYVQVTAGLGYTCAVDRPGQAYCWGAAAYGQLGVALTDDRPYPLTVLGPPFAVVAASLSRHTCALDREGRGYCWGSGESGQLGNRTTTYTPVPIPVDWTRIR